MNRSFKVVFNKTRGALMVVNEISSSVQAKGTKTVIALAIGSLLTGAAVANDLKPVVITNQTLSDIGTTKFISGQKVKEDGDSNIAITTTGNAKALAKAVLTFNKNDLKGSIKAIQSALGHDGNCATMVGFAGGHNQIDSGLHLAGNGALLVLKKPLALAALNNYVGMISSFANTVTHQGHLNINVGDEHTSPLLVMSTAGDRTVGTALNGGRFTPTKIISERVGDVSLHMHSGNTVLMSTAGSSINIGDIGTVNALGINAKFTSESVSNTLKGNGEFIAEGNTTSVLTGVGGTALALGGKSDMTVTGNTHTLINTVPSSAGYDGLTFGLTGSGVALAGLGGEATSTVEGNVDMELQQGLMAGVFGGGVAASGHIGSKLPNEIVGGVENALAGTVDVTLTDEWNKGGSATTTSGDVTIGIGSKATTAFVLGGGLAAAYQHDDAKTPTTANSSVGDVHITVGSLNEPEIDKEGAKVAFDKGSTVALKLISMVKGAINNKVLPDKQNLNDFRASLDDFIDAAAKTPGLHVGLVGGGAAVSFSRDYDQTSNQATAVPYTYTKAGDVNMNIHSGFNLGIVGGGLAGASGDAIAHEKELGSATLAESTVDNVKLNIDGGLNYGILGGGMAYAGGSNEANLGYAAKANVENDVTINVTGGEVYTIVGGGLTIDDTDPIGTVVQNAQATVQNVDIHVSSGKVGSLNTREFGFSNDSLPTTKNSSLRDHLDTGLWTTTEQKVAIVGGGVSAGKHADTETIGGSHVKDVQIILDGNAVIGTNMTDAYGKGHVFGGGLAMDGGLATVGNTNITVADNAVVNGNIYGGGLAVNNHYSVADFNKSKATVDTAEINVLGGTIKGDIHAGGQVIEGGDNPVASSTVKNATITIAKDGAFQGKVIDGLGVTETAALIFVNDKFDLKGATVKSFDTVDATSLKDFTYDFGNETATTFTGIFDAIAVVANKASTLTVANGSVFALKDAKAEHVTFKVDNGVLALGDKVDGHNAHDALANQNAIPGLYLAGKVDLTESNANIGKVAADATGVTIGSNGSLMADANASTTVTGVIHGDKTTDVYFTNVAEKDAKVVFDANGLEGFDLAHNITVDNLRYEAVNKDNTFTFKQVTDEAGLIARGLDGFDRVTLDKIEKQTDEGSKLIQGLLDQKNGAITSGEHRHAQLNAAFDLAAAAGVQTAGIESAMISLDQVSKRASLTNSFNDGWTGFAEVTGDQLKMGDDRNAPATKTTLTGLVVGGEYTQGDMTFGVLCNFGTGDVKGQDANSGVKNDVDYYGIQAYGAKRIGQFNLVGQLGYVMTQNDITHDFGHSVSVDADVFTIGGRSEMRFDLNDRWTAVPYVGLNWLRVSTAGYTTNKGISVGSSDQDLINMPIGVAFTGDVADCSGWTLKPVVDVAYVHTFGDTDLKTSSKVGDAVMGTTLDVWSDNVGRLTMGLEAHKGNMAFGFNLGGAKGDNDHKAFFGQLNAKYLF